MYPSHYDLEWSGYFDDRMCDGRYICLVAELDHDDPPLPGAYPLVPPREYPNISPEEQRYPIQYSEGTVVAFDLWKREDCEDPDCKESTSSVDEILEVHFPVGILKIIADAAV
ncbi:hypothetical protein NKR23_g1794 [Pleurostoma richardsiae]|uniref:Uncharacterized protein n=1 Tax=Pleurostoma richardsiae TaxID=41990 RepID=A0AA38VJA0_9PEZI|nr:hypothetical protein NKR23_g1794 [Pleurostoma richardsiae]